MSESIMALINLVRKRFDLFTKIFVLLFLLCLFADYLYTYYGVNILDFESILPQIVKVLLKKVEFILYWLIPFVCSIPGILFLILLIAYILEVIIKQLDKKEYFMKLSEDFYKSLSHMESYCQFISNQSFDLLQLSIVYIPFIGGVYVNDTLRMYKNDDIRMYNFDCITDTIVEVITTCNTYTLLTVHLL